jgi:hypothetical protein
MQELEKTMQELETGKSNPETRTKGWNQVWWYTSVNPGLRRQKDCEFKISLGGRNDPSIVCTYE